MNRQILSISDLKKHKAPIVPSSGILVPGKTYFITGCDGAYLFVTDYSSEVSPRSYMATRTAFDQMCTEGIKVDHVLDAGFLQPVEEAGQRAATG